MISLRVSLLLGAVLANAAPARAQTLLHDFVGPFSGAGWGSALAVVGDVNLDGRADILVGTNTSGPGGSNGTVWLYSGFDGQLIWNWTGVAPTYSGIGRVVGAAGDLNADGVPDILTTAPESTPTGPRALVYSGADASLIRSFVAPPGLSSFGYSATMIGDTNADGVPDCAVGAPLWIPNGFESGRIYVFSGSSGAQRFLVNGTAANDRFGWSLAALGDVNADGTPDFAVGAPQHNASPAQPGYVEARSGVDGSLLWHVAGGTGERQFGLSLAAVGDLDGDGKNDLAVGAPLSVVNTLTVGAVALLSGTSGARIKTYSGTSVNGLFGFSVASAGDVDRDGKPDLLIGIRDDPSPGPAAGAVLLVCTRDNGTILKLVADSGGDRLGTACASGDINADGYPDIVAGAPSDAPNGHVRVWSTTPVPPHAYCIGAPNSQTFGALIGWTGTTSVTQNNFSVTVADAIAGGPGILYYGSGSTQVPFGDGYRCVGGTIVRHAVQFAGVTGATVFALDLAQPPFSGPTLPALPGSLLFFQFWYRDTAGSGGSGFNLSNALAATFSP